MSDENSNFLSQLQFNSDNIFIKTSKAQISYREFKSCIKNISTDLKKHSLVANDLVLLDIRDPIYLAAYVFACFNLKARPALLNSYFKNDQIDSVLKDNPYSLFITDQKNTKLKVLEIDSTLPIKKEDGDLDIDVRSEILFFTSGSIQTKACVLTLENFFYSALGSSANIPFDKSNTWGLCLPLFHVGGFSILIRAILANGSVALLDNSQAYHDQLTHMSISHISFVSTQFTRYLEETPRYPPEYILLGGSSIPEKYLKKAIELKLPIYKSYGMTEMASQICTTNEIKHLDEILSSGKTLPYRDLKIVDKNIFVKGPCLFKGYLQNNRLVRSIDSEGWFDTHDYGALKDGKVNILGRADRIFQSAGENISPEIIEQELLRIPGVLRAYVCPELDTQYGYRPIAYIEKNEALDIETILTHLSNKLSGLYRPKAIRGWTESPHQSWKQ